MVRIIYKVTRTEFGSAPSDQISIQSDSILFKIYVIFLISGGLIDQVVRDQIQSYLIESEFGERYIFLAEIFIYLQHNKKKTFLFDENSKIIQATKQSYSPNLAASFFLFLFYRNFMTSLKSIPSHLCRLKLNFYLFLKPT